MEIHHLKKFTQGKQGVVGLATFDERLCVYKISQVMNFVPRHEYIVMKALEQIAPFCPHFCIAYDNVQLPIHYEFTERRQDPFEQCKLPIYLDVLMMEYIEDAISLSDFIVDPKVEFKQILSVIKQVLVALLIAQKETKFVHYDLHASNILLRRCNPDLTHIYVLEDGSIISIPTFGYVPVIIDFGFARADSVENNPMYNSLNYSDIGFLYPMFDPFADAKIFLITMCVDIKSYIDSNTATYFRNVIKNIFGELKVDWDNGWDCEDESVISDIVKYIEGDLMDSEFYSQHIYFIMEILQSLVYLPFSTDWSKVTLREFRSGFKGLMDELLPIEETLDPFYMLYFLHRLVDKSRHLFRKYDDESVAQLGEILDELLHELDLEDVRTAIDTDILFCSLMVIQIHMEGKIVQFLNERLHIKNEEYKKMPVSSTAEILSIIEAIFPNKEPITNALVFDSIHQTNFYLLDEDIQNIKAHGLVETMNSILNEEEDEDPTGDSS